MTQLPDSFEVIEVATPCKFDSEGQLATCCHAARPFRPKTYYSGVALYQFAV